jgi:hypothetical protein
VLLKLTSHTSTELLEEALTMKNARNVCGQLMSLIIANKGLTNSFHSSWFMVFNATFNNMSDISWQSVLLVEKT